MTLPHTSKHFPSELLEHLESAEWEAQPTLLTLQCGHTVKVKPGDTVWFYKDDDCTMFFAVDPVTIQ